MTFLQEVVDILLAYIVESFDRETKVIDFHYPNQLLQMNNWELQDEPATLDDILISCRATLKYAIKTGRNRIDVVRFRSIADPFKNGLRRFVKNTFYCHNKINTFFCLTSITGNKEPNKGTPPPLLPPRPNK